MWREVLRLLRRDWPTLLAVSVAAKVLVAAAFGPIAAVVLQLGLWLGGEPVVTDLDLLSIARSPVALVAAAAAVVLGVTGWAIELVAMASVLRGRSLGAWPAIRDTLARTNTIARLSGWVLVESAKWLGPLVVVIAAAYLTLLRRYDINYYLTEKPPAFWGSAAVAALAAGYALWGMAKLLARWLAAPGMVADGLGSSETRRAVAARGAPPPRARLALGQWLAASALAPVALAALGAGVFAVAAPWWPRSLTAIAIGLGLCVVAGWAAALACNLLSTAALAGLAAAMLPTNVSPDERPAAPSWLTRGRVAAGAVLLVLLSAVAGFAAIGAATVDDDIAVIAHRGAALAAPENTLASVRAAIDAGADWVEIDVQESRDGEVIVFHDSDFMKAAGVATKVWDVTAEELARIDVGARVGPEFAGERVPTLGDVLELCRDRIGVLVELKYYGHNVDLERRVADRVEAAGMAPQTMFMSLDRAGVRRLKALRPDWRVGLLLSVYVGRASHLEADFLAMNASFINARSLRVARRQGREVYAWTVNDPVAMASLASLGVAGLITDDPALARGSLDEWSDLSPVGRLLLQVAGSVGPKSASAEP